MAKKIKTIIKLQIAGGQANPAPPVGTALGPHGLNIMEFTTAFNEKTRDKMGVVLPVVITVYEDRTFDFIIKAPAATYLLKSAAKVDKGSGEVPRKKVGTISKDKLKEIAETKMPDLNAYNPEEAMKILEGTAMSMGIDIV